MQLQKYKKPESLPNELLKKRCMRKTYDVCKLDTP